MTISERPAPNVGQTPPIPEPVAPAGDPSAVNSPARVPNGGELVGSQPAQGADTVVRATARPVSDATPRDTLAALVRAKDTVPRSSIPATDFTRIVRENFESWDTNGDGTLEMDEVRVAAADPAITGRPAAALATIVTQMETLEDLSDDHMFFEDGLHPGDLDQIDRMAASGDVDEQREARAFSNRMNFAFNRVRATHRDLFADPMAGPDFEAVKQGMIGDCWVVAAVAAMAEDDPQAIVNMIEEQDDGRFEVTFPGGRSVTVDRPTETELGFLGTTGNDGIWLAVLEKAVGEMEGASDTQLDHEPIANGGQPGRAIRILTGQSATSVRTGRGTPTDDEFLTTLDTAHGAGRLMVASRSDDDDASELPDKHAYSVIDVDPNARTVTIRNPWGRGERNLPNGQPRDGVNDGVMTLSIREFREWMDHVAIEDAP